MQLTENDNRQRQLAAIVGRAQRLDPEAFDELIGLFGARLSGFFQRMLGSKKDVEDLVQEVYLRVVRSIGAYRENGRFEAWLFRIAGNVFRDFQRKGGRGDDRVGPTNHQGEEIPAIESPAGFGNKFHLDRLQMCLMRLGSDEREVILLRHFGRMSFAEIAEHSSVPLGTILSRAHRSLAKLREMMEDCDE